MFKIEKIKSIDDSISIIIHINNKCNFKCSYCIAGRKFSNEELSLKQIKILLINITKILKVYNTRKVIITLTGGEPTISDSFLMFFEELLNFDNIKIRVSTNGFFLYNYEKFLSSDIVVNNLEKVFFSISFHYFEYINKIDSFLKTIKILLINNLKFKIKFLLPDNNININEFKIIRDNILSLGISKSQYVYGLILNSNNEVSETYDSTIIHFYKNFLLKRQKNNVNNLIIESNNGVIYKFSEEQLINKKLNKFKGYKCSYISNSSIIAQVSHLGELFFGPCYTLKNKKFKLNELSSLILSGGKSIICTEDKCISGLILKKENLGFYNNIILIEQKFLNYLNKYLYNYSTINISISIHDYICIKCLYENLNIEIYIYKKDIGSYFYKKNSYFFIVNLFDNSNIYINIDNISQSFKKLIFINLDLLSKITLFDKYL